MKPRSVFLLFLTFSLLLQTSTPTVVPLQLLSLLSLKSSLKDPLSNLHDWELTSAFSTSKPNSQVDPIWCSWKGVKCNPNSTQITTLDLSRRNLSGAIPAGVRYLSGLIHLSLSTNKFDGPFQPAIFELAKLRTLDISHNQFNSTFPLGISKLKFLRVLDAYDNNFTGPLPQDLVHLRFLELLNLSGNYFEGSIPASYGNFSRLKLLNLAGNELDGPIPPELGFLKQLEQMEIYYNNLEGGIPVELSLLSKLRYLDISNSNLSRTLPPELGNLTMLEELHLYQNQISGEIPESFGELKGLRHLALSQNHLWGMIPKELGTLERLTWLNLESNNLTGEIPEMIGKLPNLDTLILWNNSLNGTLPRNLGSNAKLKSLDVSSNLLTGQIPPTLCLGNRLSLLVLFSNRLIDQIPRSLTNCTSLSRFRIQNNQLNGSIPYGFGSLSNLTFVDLSRNNLSGPIPDDLFNAIKLEYINISYNQFHAILPENIWNATKLLIFSANSAKLMGEIPSFIWCQSLYKIELEGNSLNGSIPSDISNCQRLLFLKLSRNSLSDMIPSEISTLPSIAEVDLSRNFLTGTIPSNFANCTTLSSFNVSYNLLIGPIPSGAVFSNLHPSSFLGNKGLCGAAILAKPCANVIEVHREQPEWRVRAITWRIALAVGISIFMMSLFVIGLFVRRRRILISDDHEIEIGMWRLTPFQRLNFTADDVVQCLSTTEDKILGAGSQGTVYKVEMPGGLIIAVKKLLGNHGVDELRRKGVLAEIEVLGKVRHRNILRLLGCSGDGQCTMLLYEYMPNGTLSHLLHGRREGRHEDLIADWVTRYKIALGVAKGICYLHHDYDTVIVHRDLKPDNILLDEEMEAKVGDFGLAKLIQSDEPMSAIAGTFGYIAPEYANTLQVGGKSDVYSYGVVLLEMLTRKRPLGAEYGEGETIVDWVRSKIGTEDGINDILDKSLEASSYEPVRGEMVQMLGIALLCTKRNPADRPSMRDVMLMLDKAKPKRPFVNHTVLTEDGGQSS